MTDFSLQNTLLAFERSNCGLNKLLRRSDAVEKEKKNTRMCITEINTIADIVKTSIETSIKGYHFADIHLSSIMHAILLVGHTGVPTILLDMVKVAILMEVEDNYVAIVDSMHMEIVATHLNLHTGVLTIHLYLGPWF